MYILDTNNNGYIDYTEFIAGCMKSKIYLKEDHLRIAFSYFDKVSATFFILKLDSFCVIITGQLWIHHNR